MYSGVSPEIDGDRYWMGCHRLRYSDGLNILAGKTILRRNAKCDLLVLHLGAAYWLINRVSVHLFSFLDYLISDNAA